VNLESAVARACEEPTLLDALTWIAIWEAERAIQQALEQQRTGISTAAAGSWDTCFRTAFQRVLVVLHTRKGQ